MPGHTLKQSRRMHQINIWLVEDNLRYRKSLFGLINDTAGMVCQHAFNSCENALKAGPIDPPPDVILLDIGLPGMNGIQGIEQFKLMFPQTYIVILTVYDDNDKVFNAICAGASGYLLKDSSSEKIIGSIQEVLAGGAPMNMPIAHKVLEMFAQMKHKKSDYGLTEREKEILQHMVAGLTKQQIADKLYISFHTVDSHLKHIYTKLQVSTRSGAVSKAYKENIL